MTEVDTTLYCYNHPDKPTALRCNRCEKPICARCARPTPTGYRCPDCLRNQQKVFDTSQWYDYFLASITAIFLSFIGSRIVPSLGFFTLFITPIAGVIIAEVVRAIIRRRRSKRLFQITAIATAVGSLPLLIISTLPAVLYLSEGGVWLLGSLLWHGVYTFTVTTTVYYRLAGINFRA